jgi:hypothetical protein
MASILEASRVSLVILDLMLPGEDGLALCRQLRATGTLPINASPMARGHLRMTRGRCGSLLLHRDGLAPSTPCRSPGALRSTPDKQTFSAPIDKSQSAKTGSDREHEETAQLNRPNQPVRIWAAALKR